MYIYLAGVLPISYSFFFYLDPLISHLKSVCGDKIASDNSVVGQCMLLESLTSLVSFSFTDGKTPEFQLADSRDSQKLYHWVVYYNLSEFK